MKLLSALRIKTYLPQLVYGGIDGIVTTFAVVAGAAGAGFSTKTIIVLGSANLIADGFSMSVGSYLSKEAEIDMNESNGKTSAFSNAVATFISFNLIGIIPLLVFVIPVLNTISDTNKFLVSTVLTLLAFVVIGLFKSEVSHKHVVRGVIETVILGSVSALLAFLAGTYLDTIIN
jgi:vacuolar iron transporter family protein